MQVDQNKHNQEQNESRKKYHYNNRREKVKLELPRKKEGKRDKLKKYAVEYNQKKKQRKTSEIVERRSRQGKWRPKR